MQEKIYTMAKQRSVNAKVTPINVPVYELPEFVCVETRWITKDTVDFEKLLNTNLVMKLNENQNNNNKPKVKLTDNCTMTHAVPLTTISGNPSRERFVQTELKQTSDNSTQCNFDDEWENWTDKGVPSTNITDVNRLESIFLKYVSENTSMFPNGMLECMLCGEVAKALQEHQNHMSGHYGPRQLCHRCGRKIKSWLTHNYNCPEYPKAVKAKRRQMDMEFKCPHLQCQLIAKSSTHLRHHMLKEHFQKSAYSCKQCKGRFKTSLGFLLHRQMYKMCLRSKPIFLYSHKKNNLYGGVDPKRCSICLKRFISGKKCSMHRSKCLKAHLSVSAGKLCSLKLIND